MQTLKSYVLGDWHEAKSGFATLVDPSTEEPVARASSEGIDFGAVLDHARERGGPALRGMTFGERAQLLKGMSKVLRDHRDELLDLSALNNGTTRPDGSFDVDGASGTLAYYASLGRGLGDRRVLNEDEGTSLSRSGGFWARHALVPRRGVAVHVNAFNFPAWGFAEKAACALLAGMPVITKPATATSLVTARAVELLVEAGILPEGALQLVVGGTGDLLDRLGPQDVLAFTGSAETARKLRNRPNLLAANTRVNVEADSLNAAVLGPDVEPSGPTFDLFLKDVAREITQKTGQKCTAVRRVLVPRERLDAAQEALAARLREVVPGSPVHEGATMGPVATAQQLEDVLEGIQELARGARIVLGDGRRAQGAGVPEGKGFFVAPTLLRVDEVDPLGGAAAEAVHRREVFGPVATLLPYDGTPEGAAAVIALGGGTLVTSAYTDDAAWAGDFLAHGGGNTGRVYLGSAEAAAEAPGSGAALPQSLHGGPGRAGGGEELGGLVGVKLYLQRVAVQGARPMVDEVVG